MSNVFALSVVTRLDIDPQQIIENALGKGLTQVVICGFDADGNEYFASSVADAGNCMFHLDRAKWALMRQIDRIVEGEE